MSDGSEMISFNCGGCGRAYLVPPIHAGRSGKCKTCGGALVVPPTSSSAPAPVPEPAAPANAPPAETRPLLRPATPPSTSPKIPMRVRRLNADAELMAKTFVGDGPIRLKAAIGNPPSTYQLEYAVRGLERGKKNEPVIRELHLVEIDLTSDYPRMSPHCKMLTPVFHPNIDARTICVGDHWTAGERLIDLAVRIGEMIAYQAYNIKSPLDGEAAMWADLNADKIPIDSRSLRPGEQD